MVSALTDRGGKEAETKLSILAVGDDDQNIYTFRGANVAYIRQFRDDYHAEPEYLLENFRSTAHILAAANQLISQNRDRMKTEQTIHVDRRRQGHPPGGDWERLDPLSRGRVQLLSVQPPGEEAAAIAGELQRLGSLTPDWDWSRCAVLARTRDALQPVRAICEHLHIPVVWGLENERLPRLSRIREISAFLENCVLCRDEDQRTSDLLDWLPSPTEEDNPWHRLLVDLLGQWQEDSGDRRLPVAQLYRKKQNI